MNWLKKIRNFAVLLFVCSFLISTSLSSCKGKTDEKESADHPAGEDAEKSEHPENDSDSTKVEEQ